MTQLPRYAVTSTAPLHSGVTGLGFETFVAYLDAMNEASRRTYEGHTDVVMWRAVERDGKAVD